MKLQKHEVCVFIENEAQLQEARELLEKYGEEITSEPLDFQFIDYESNYLSLDFNNHVWVVYDKSLPHETQITLSQLEEILKEER